MATNANEVIVAMAIQLTEALKERDQARTELVGTLGEIGSLKADLEQLEWQVSKKRKKRRRQ